MDTAAPIVEGYEVLREVGRGGSSTVYAARQVGIDRLVAVKVLHADLSDASARRRFERECAVLGALGDTPGVLPVYASAFTADGRGCIVMPLLVESLSDRLVRTGPLTGSEVAAIGASVAAALAVTHDRGIVHRDIKPGNLLVSELGDVYLGDFDLATSRHHGVSTVTSQAVSPPHAAPERLTGTDDGAPAGDIWSLGSTLFTLLNGSPPFGTPNDPGGMAGLIDRVLNDPVPQLAGSSPADPLAEVIERALRKDPAQRWSSGEQIVEVLARALEQGSIGPGATGPGAIGGPARPGALHPAVSPADARAASPDVSLPTARQIVDVEATQHPDAADDRSARSMTAEIDAQRIRQAIDRSGGGSSPKTDTASGARWARPLSTAMVIAMVALVVVLGVLVAGWAFTAG